jgi:hypothetical protein
VVRGEGVVDAGVGVRAHGGQRTRFGEADPREAARASG